MPVLIDLLNWIGDARSGVERTNVHYECRRCGTTLSTDEANCSSCGSTEIAAIPL